MLFYYRTIFTAFFLATITGMSAISASALSTLTDLEPTKSREQPQEKAASAPDHVRVGDLLLRRGEWDEAIRSFDAALRLNPHSHEAKTGRGVAMARKDNLKEAEAALLDALVQNPNPVRTHFELGRVYQDMGMCDKAVIEFKEGIRKHEQGRL